MHLHFRNWSDADKEALATVRSFKEMAVIALGIMMRNGGEFHMVSGPISTGGVGSIEGNRRVFMRVIEHLISEEGLPVWSQMPFQDKMVDLYKIWHAENPNESYCMPILLDFYEPVFSSGFVKVLHFIHGYESSFGARWEHQGCERWGIERRYLPAELSRMLVTA